VRSSEIDQALDRHEGSTAHCHPVETPQRSNVIATKHAALQQNPISGLVQSIERPVCQPLPWILRTVLDPVWHFPNPLAALRAATDPGVLGGQYFGPDGFAGMRGYPKVVVSSLRSHDVSVEHRLWIVP
jgi:hypothetical protein